MRLNVLANDNANRQVPHSAGDPAAVGACTWRRARQTFLHAHHTEVERSDEFVQRPAASHGSSIAARR